MTFKEALQAMLNGNKVRNNGMTLIVRGQCMTNSVKG